MNIEITKEEKNDVEFKIDNTTIAEILRVYLYENGAEFAAWRREHPSRPSVMRIKTSGKTVGKAVADSVTAIKKDCAAILAAVKK